MVVDHPQIPIQTPAGGQAEGGVCCAEKSNGSSFGGFLSHGGYPKHGWVFRSKTPIRMDDLGLPNDLGNLYFLMNLGNEVHPTSTAGADDEGTTNQKESEQDQVQDVPSGDHGCVPMLALRFEPN